MTLQEGLKPESGWSEQKAPALQEWKTPGDFIEGVLLSLQVVKMKDKNVPQYMVQFKDGTIVKFAQTYDLKQKLHSRHIGCGVRIKYLGEDENIKGGTSNTPMKVFSVFTKGTPTQQSQEQGPITDEDIPF
jgi:hypothetical protein